MHHRIPIFTHFHPIPVRLASGYPFISVSTRSLTNKEALVWKEGTAKLPQAPGDRRSIWVGEVQNAQLKKKPKFWTRVKTTFKDIGIGFGIGVVVAHKS
ncbi:MAG: hypothetical protein WBW70_19995 [Candidatus Sulfotelmatobacter sp.]|jgi:hypothetical protein